MSRNGYEMHLFGGFELKRAGVRLDLPQSVQRLLSLVALNDRSLPRRLVADTLWPDAEEERAQANLRTTLWRLHSQQLELLDVSAVDLALIPAIWVDARALHDAAREHRRTGQMPDPETLLYVRGELLPGCWDSWLVFDRERLRQEAIHLLEATSKACLGRGDVYMSTMLALCAVECDPLRESANVLLVKAHLAAGYTAGALQHARHYGALLADELGIPLPSVLEDLLWQHRRSAERAPAESARPLVATAG
jgi:DNA-binding SARP family transcriptional activator